MCTVGVEERHGRQPQHGRKTSIVTSDGDGITKLTSKFWKSSEEWCCAVQLTYLRCGLASGIHRRGREGDEVEEAETRWNGVG